MADDWQPGDLALCVRMGGSNVRPGGVYTVEEVFMASNGVLSLMLIGVRSAVGRTGGYAAYGFRKIRPHTPDAEDAETIRLLTGAPVRGRTT